MPICRSCGEDKDSARYEKSNGGKAYGRPVCTQCWSKSRAEYQKAYRARHSERLKAYDREKYQNDPEYQADIRRRHYRKLQKIVFDHYGNECACCGESEPIFLSIDHVNNDGAEHRKEIGVGHILFRWIIDNDFPKTLQLLCCNCNLGKHRNGGVCPHDASRLNYVNPSERLTTSPEQ